MHVLLFLLVHAALSARKPNVVVTSTCASAEYHPGDNTFTFLDVSDFDTLPELAASLPKFKLFPRDFHYSLNSPSCITITNHDHEPETLVVDKVPAYTHVTLNSSTCLENSTPLGMEILQIQPHSDMDFCTCTTQPESTGDLEFRIVQGCNEVIVKVAPFWDAIYVPTEEPSFEVHAGLYLFAVACAMFVSLCVVCVIQKNASATENLLLKTAILQSIAAVFSVCFEALDLLFTWWLFFVIIYTYQHDLTKFYIISYATVTGLSVVINIAFMYLNIRLVQHSLAFEFWRMTKRKIKVLNVVKIVFEKLPLIAMKTYLAIVKDNNFIVPLSIALSAAACGYQAATLVFPDAEVEIDEFSLDFDTSRKTTLESVLLDETGRSKV